ncbi:LysR substrate-binding domain-containing protein [Achromobacter xylosoxidans]
MEVSGPLSSDNGEALRSWCLAGLGISLRESWDVAEDLRAGHLVRVLPDWEESGSPISAVHARREPSPASFRFHRLYRGHMAHWSVG